MLASTEGMSRPSSNTNTDRPARSPAGSGATFRSRAGRCSAAAAAVSAAVTACCWAVPAAAAVTIVTGPAAPATRPPAADCDSTLLRTAAADGAATTVKPPGAACASPVVSRAVKPGRRGHRDPHPVRRGGVIGVAVGQREDEAGRRGRDRDDEQPTRRRPATRTRRVRHDTMVAFPGSASHQ